MMDEFVQRKYIYGFCTPLVGNDVRGSSRKNAVHKNVWREKKRDVVALSEMYIFSFLCIVVVAWSYRRRLSPPKVLSISQDGINNNRERERDASRRWRSNNDIYHCHWISNDWFFYFSEGGRKEYTERSKDDSICQKVKFVVDMRPASNEIWWWILFERIPFYQVHHRPVNDSRSCWFRTQYDSSGTYLDFDTSRFPWLMMSFIRASIVLKETNLS